MTVFNLQFNGFHTYLFMYKQLVILLLLVALSQGATKLQIISVSSSPASVQNPVYSSLKGGRLVYINAVGHSTNPSQIEVKTGTYPCKLVDEGVSSDFIVCTTTDTGRSSSQSVPVYLTSKKETVQSSYPHYVIFSQSYTPSISEVFPSSSYAGQTVSVEGNHVTSNFGSNELEVGSAEVKMGEDVCDRYMISSSGSKLNCQQSKQTQAGKKKIQTQVQYGKSSESQNNKQATLVQGDDFSFTTIPAVNKVTNQGNKAGQEIEIEGTGFSANKQKNNVTVDGNECEVTEASNNKIKCTLKYKDQNKTSKLATNDSSQSKGYFSGVGLQYVRYSYYSSSIFGFVSSYRSNPNGMTKLEESIKTEIRSGTMYGSYYGEVWKGYFTAPVSGTYTFRGWGQYAFAIYLSETAGTAQLPSVPLIYSESNQRDWNNFFLENVKTASATISLVEGHSYYLQAFHIAYYYTGKFKVFVEVPNSNKNLEHLDYHTDQIDITAEVQPEVMRYSMIGGSQGVIDLKIIRTDSSGLITYNQNRTVSYGCEAGTFLSALYTFNSFYNYNPSVQRFMYDSIGNLTSNISKAKRIDYEVSLYLMRPDSYQQEEFIITPYGYDGTFEQKQIIPHSPLINGSYTINLGGNQASIPYNVAASSLQSWIRSIKGLEEVEVAQRTNLGYTYDGTWIISYKGYKGSIPPLVINPSSLTGGITSPNITHQVIRNYTGSVVFEPIDYRFLNTADSQPNVLVNVNEIPAVCISNCSYNFTDSSKIVNMSMSGSKLVLIATKPTTLNLTEGDVQVKVSGLKTSVNFTANDTHVYIESTLQTNPDGTPILVAGTLEPEVYFEDEGYVQPDTNVTFIEVPFVVFSIQQTQGPNNGGYLNTIDGSGFVGVGQTKNLNVALSKGNAAITVTICNQSAQIKTVANKKIVFYVPQCSGIGPYPVNVSDGTYFSANTTFTYIGASPAVVPAISSISPANSNPKLKSTINITGSHFGNSTEGVHAYLVDKDTGKTYQLRILSLNDTLIRCGLSGGLSGTYRVQVKFDAFGDAIVTGINEFKYTFQIDSVTPTTGSFYGGTLLTITGQNFLTGSGQTLSYIGDAINWFCKIQTLTATQITCLTPPFYPEYKLDEPQEVLVSSKLTSFSDCPASNCNFTYLSAAECANLTNISTSSVYGGTTLFFTGFNFTLSNGCNITFRHTLTNKVTILPALNCFPSTANITIPKDLASGRYYVSVNNKDGDSNPQILYVYWNIGSISLSYGSTEGAYLKISGGSGYPSEISGDYKLTIIKPTAADSVSIISCCQNNVLQAFVPPAPNGSMFIFQFSSSLGMSYLYFYSMSDSSYTPTFNITTPTSLTLNAGTTSFILNRTSSVATTISNITFRSTINSSDETSVGSWSTSGTYTNFSVSLRAGSYHIYVNGSTGYYSNSQVVNVRSNILSVPSQLVSFQGGTLNITGQLSKSAYITVNGFKGCIAEHTDAWVLFDVPPFVNQNSQTMYNLKTVDNIPVDSLQFFNDSGALNGASKAFDDDLSSNYQSSSSGQCWIGMDAGLNLMLSVYRIKFFPKGSLSADKYIGSSFEGSNDMSSWTTIVTLDQNVHGGWNTRESKVTTPFRYLRYKHNSTTSCSLAEIQLYGITFSNQTVNESSVTYFDGYNQIAFPYRLNFSVPATPVVTTVDPPYGDIFGGYALKLTGQFLGTTSNVEILIDGVPCVYVNSSTSELTCIVGARNVTPTKNTFVVMIQGKKAVIKQQFLYVLKWSDPRTWGTDLPPVQGDLIFVPAGQTLLVDQDTPQVEGIAVQNGTIIFSNSTNITVKTGFITMVGGRLIAGTEEHPHHANLTFEMYGGYYGAQQPMAGNKGIFCLDCKLSIYGKPRNYVWTTLSSTVLPGISYLNVTNAVDWQPGEKIVVASTSFDPAEAEERTIVSVSGISIFVDKPFLYKHLGFVESHGSDSIKMQAEVGLLSRNIKITGDSTTSVDKYGAHMKLSGTESTGFEGKVAYTEFTLCGQPQIPGRYCLYFHLNGYVPTSLARGNSFHETLGRGITLRGTSMLEIEQNVAFRARGHNFYLEDGTEIYNKIKDNLAINSLAVSNLYYTDMAVSSFLIKNPTNDVIGNRAAGSDFYGLWFDFSTKVEGASAKKDICPDGLPLGDVSNNVIHSNKIIGMRINRLLPRTFPCASIRNNDPEDQWLLNPSLPSLISNSTIYKNQWYGILAQETGNLVFQNLTLAQNYKSGLELEKANFTKENVKVKNSVFIGKTTSNADDSSTKYGLSMAGLTTPRTGSAELEAVRFYGFPTGSSALAICSKCDSSAYFTNLGTEVFVSALSFSDIQGKAINMLGYNNDVIYSADNSLISYFNTVGAESPILNGTILYQWPHIANAEKKHCFLPLNSSIWDGTMFCDQSLTIRRVYFTNIYYPYNFWWTTMYFAPIFNESVRISSVNNSLVSGIGSSQPLVEKWLSWSLPFVAGYKYAAWWSTSNDFTHLSIVTSTLYREEDPAIVFKFQYITSREMFYVGPMRGGVGLTFDNYMPQSIDFLDPETCSNGDYYHTNDNSSKMISVCQSGKNRTKFEYTEVNAVFCKYLCPKPVIKYSSSCDASKKQTFIRLWSNASMWPDEQIPKAGDNVTIQCDWTVLVNVDPEPINFLIIDGDVVLDDSRDVNITANSIHIRAGSFTAGTSSIPFIHKLIFQLNGGRSDNYYNVDPLLLANKLFVVTGSLELIGKTPASTSTYLTQTAFKGNDTIYVGSSSDWKVGDSLGIYPSFSNPNEHEEVSIKTINSDGSVVLSAALKYTHYGSSSVTISQSFGTLDARTRVVHLSRNIKIVAGPDYSHGYSLTVYKYFDNTNLRLGNILVRGVQFRNGGQTTMTNAAVQFINVIGSIALNQISYSSFVGCGSRCLNVQNSQNVTIKNTVFFGASGAAVVAQGSNLKSFSFTSNVLGAVTTGYSYDACFALAQQFRSIYKIEVKGNVCQGSQGSGFIFPHVMCSDIDNHTLTNNLAGSCAVGFELTDNKRECQAFSSVNAYACGIGHNSGPQELSEIQYKKFILADNQRGVTLNFGGHKNSIDNIVIFNDSYVTALSRPSCSECYGDTQTKCAQLIGLRMLSVIEGTTHSTYLDYFDNSQSLDAKAFLSNVTFDNFKQNYTGAYATTVLLNCKNNFAFRSHPYAIDAVGGHYLFDSKCLNCDNNSYIYCEKSDESVFSNQGGCGDSSCTGKENYLLMDQTGDFFGFLGVVIPNNKAIGNNEDQCVWSEIMNGHLCARSDFIVLEYDSRAPDYNSRRTYPVALKGQTCNYTTIINGWREWEWSGSLANNKRLNRFVSIVKTATEYNMTFAAMPPLDLTMQLQRRSPEGNSSNYVVLRIYYPLPNAIRVFVAGRRKSPIINTNVANFSYGGINRVIDTATCGDNIYFYTNRTVKLVLTEDPDCVVKLSVTDSIQLTAHFAMDAKDFFVDTVMSNFIDNLCALLNIVDQSRVKIVGVNSGSAIVDTVIEAENDTEASAGADSSMAEISTTLATTINNGTFAATMQANVGYTVLTATGTFYVLPATEEVQTTEEGTTAGKDMSVLIGIIAGAVVVMLVIFIVIYCVYRKRMAMHQAIVAQASDKEKDEVVQVQNQKEESHNIIMSDSVFFAYEVESPTKVASPPSPLMPKKRNRRIRNRQHLQIRDYD